MNIKITSITTKFDDDGSLKGVQVYFSGSHDDRTVNLNGYVPLKAEEYEGNESLTKLEDKVRKYVSEQVLNSPEDEPETDAE